MRETLRSHLRILLRVSWRGTREPAPLHLLVIAAFVLGGFSGCIVAPIPQDHVNGRAVNVDPLTIKTGVTTEEDVLLRLGDPDAIWNERLFVYSWDHVNWAILWMIGAETGGAAGTLDIPPRHQMLLIQFDEGGHVLRTDRTEVPSDTNLQEFLKTWAEQGQANGKL